MSRRKSVLTAQHRTAEDLHETQRQGDGPGWEQTEDTRRRSEMPGAGLEPGSEKGHREETGRI